MTRQEQIEGMVTIIGNVKPFYVETIAEALYDAGYCQVLFDTENGKAVDVVQYAPWKLVEGYTEREVEKARKETAREILDKLNALMKQYHYKSTAWRNCANFIKETYSVEVKG